MHQFSFDFGDPFFDLAGWQVSLQVITFQNAYGLDAARSSSPWSPSSCAARRRPAPTEVGPAGD
jgi:hypothetical protein